MLLIALAAAVTATYAVWVENTDDSKFIRFGVIQENASVKYQIFVPVDANGARLPGTMEINPAAGINNVRDRKYLLSDPADIENIAGYGLVGWDGSANITLLQIPRVYTMEVNGEPLEKPVTRVLADGGFSGYLLYGNRTIKKVVIGGNVLSIAGGAFGFMTSLEELVFENRAEGTAAEILVGDYAFAGCGALAAINEGNRNITGNLELIFYI